MAEAVTVKNFRDGTITIVRGASTYVIAYEAGDLQLTPPRYDVSVVYDRGEIAGLRKTTKQPGSFSFTAHFRSIADAGSVTLVDMIEKTGAAAGYSTTGATGYEPDLADLLWTVESTDHEAAIEDSTITATSCRYLWDVAEGDPTSINITGEIYGTVTRAGETTP